ncbi:hypothetical protein SAMN04488109_0430 [Chryseolinea serpens]|uniref:TIR domain-containing protein n=1 Tax=Chryseolinea serpens TaxID=947013 RepID=A0A1M5K3J8_9BACT|nr:toll/interleukin-1 receptor domain-containing protein [Chryseolinea serpens]SHG47378.1 hypothetical protein SAMN04488109_0430 [Chryseolinea serpens]
MFKGYKLGAISFRWNYKDLIALGSEQFDSYGKKVKSSLDSFLLVDGSLDASKIIDTWFPGIDAHVFISHSHQDNDDVLALAGWLKKHFGINSFIDSCIWGYGKDLIKQLDDKYNEIEPNLYSYPEVINSATHVSMMLSSALNVMIDKTECLIFYRTPNSIQPFGSNNTTHSPWIYSEIAFSSTVRLNKPPRVQLLEEKTKMLHEQKDHLEKAQVLRYTVNDKHLKKLDVETLQNWRLSHVKTSGPLKALDTLYELTFPLKDDRPRILG